MRWYRYLVAAMLAFGCAALVAAAPVEDGGKGDKDKSGEKNKGGKGEKGGKGKGKGKGGEKGEKGDKKKPE